METMLYLTRRIWLSASAGLLALGTLPAHAADLAAAQAFITELGQEAVSVLARKDLSPAERQQQLGRFLASGFDMPLIARLVLGQPYRQLSAQKRTEYGELFEDFVLRTYSARLSSYAGENMVVTRATAASGDDAVVSSRITRPGAEPLRVDWRVRPEGSSFKIIDVIVEGVSMVVTQRSEFQAIVQNQGVEGLISTLRTRIERASAGSAVAS
jgi:phospholipid transport system substrate-binding protein